MATVTIHSDNPIHTNAIDDALLFGMNNPPKIIFDTNIKNMQTRITISDCNLDDRYAILMALHDKDINIPVKLR